MVMAADRSEAVWQQSRGEAQRAAEARAFAATLGASRPPPPGIFGNLAKPLATSNAKGL
jgi:hypothetical protein